MSTIFVDNLTGKTSAGSITVTSEGGAATQSLQQGLIKVWGAVDQTSTGHPLYDSLNVSSTTDAAESHTIITISNAMSNANYSVAGFGQAQDHGGSLGGFYGKSTGTAARTMSTTSFTSDNRTPAGSADDLTYWSFQVAGDLA